jgi:hypothetical protein
MAARIQSERGSALTEAAIIFPCLVLIVMWTSAMTDVMVLKLKAAEALRYALWETTVYKAPSQINSEVQQKWMDLRSPRDEQVGYTGLLMYPLTRDMLWRAEVDDTSTPVSLGGHGRRPDLPPGSGGHGIIGTVVGWLAGAISLIVDSQASLWQFNTHGEALARVTLMHARHDEQVSPILKGGDLLGLRGGNDLDHDKLMTNFTFQAPIASHRRMRLIFDTWKAWPKPDRFTFDGAGTNVGTTPQKTYPEVERQVSSQVDKIAFFGVNNLPGVETLRHIVSKIMGAAVVQWVVGGRLPELFSSERMDDMSQRGPITILPPEQPRESWVPSRCEIAGSDQPCPNQRVGDVTGTGKQTLDADHSIGDGVDRTRYTLPYKINTVYWSKNGGIDHDNLQSARLTSVSKDLTEKNGYVRTFECRGHFFAGSVKAQEPDVTQRYKMDCR